MVGVTFATIATLTDSIVSTIPVHIIGDLTFFLFVWPHDEARHLIWEGGADGWFWIHVAQAVIFTGLAVLALKRLAAVGRSGLQAKSREAGGPAPA